MRDRHDYRRAILDQLLRCSEHGMKFGDMQRAIKWNTYSLRAELNRLVDEGLVQRFRIIHSNGHPAVRYRLVAEKPIIWRSAEHERA